MAAVFGRAASGLAKFAARNPELVGTAVDAAGQFQTAQSVTPQTGYMPQQTGYMPQQTGYMPPQTGYMPQQTGYMPQQTGYMPPQTGYMEPQSAFYMPPQAGPMAGMPVSEETATSGLSFFALFYSFGSAFLPFIWVFLQPTILPFMFGQIIIFGGITLGLKYMADWEWRNSAIAGWLVQGIIFFFIYYFINRNVIRLATGF